MHVSDPGRNNNIIGSRKQGGNNYQGNEAEGGQNCPNGDTCDKAHNRVEEFYHPDKYKAKFCSSYLDPQKNAECDYQEFCSFAHSEAELSVELIEKYDVDMDFYMFHFICLSILCAFYSW